MTNDEIVRLDQRVVNLEAVILDLVLRVNTLEQAVASANTKVDVLNEFYGGSLQTLTGRLLDSVVPLKVAP